MPRRSFYFTPEGPAPLPDLLALLQQAVGSIRLAMFALTLPSIAMTLTERRQAGVDVRCILDSIEALAPAEKAVILSLQAGNVPLAIGESADHQFMHEKFVVVDGHTTAYGSWNASVSASRETNHWIIERSHPVAALFTQHWDAAWQAITGSPPA